MARFNSGWVKLWRKAAEGDLVDNAYLWTIWSWLLMAATYKPTKVLWCGKQRELPPGSVVFGITELAAKWECSRATISKWVHYLHDTGRITLEARTHGCVATICNWDVYQSSEDEVLQPSGDQVNADWRPSERQVALSKEVKKEEEKKGEGNPTLVGNLRSQSEEAGKVWEQSLEAFGVKRKISSHEQVHITRAIQHLGAELVLLALEGVRYEKKNEKFDRTDHLNLSRILERQKIESHANRALSRRPKTTQVFDPDKEAAGA